QPARATAFLVESLGLYRQVGSERGIASWLVAWADKAAAESHPEQTARLLGAAEAHLTTIGVSYDPADPLEQRRLVDATQAALGEEAFAVASAAGHAMPIEQAIASALADAPPAAAPSAPRARSAPAAASGAATLTQRER